MRSYGCALAALGYGLLTTVFILLGTVTQTQAAVPTEPGALDLATLSSDVDLAKFMQVHDGNEQQALSLEQLLAAPEWQQGERALELLAAPREFSIVWLNAVVSNTSDKPLTRWLNISPWRLNQVNAWFLDPETQQVLATAHTGLNFSVAERSLERKRALVPVTLAPGESQRLMLKITSDSRPFLTIHSWNPIDFLAEKATSDQAYTIFLTAILTLLAVLLLQGNRQYALIGVWMLVVFIFESEKEGYVSFVLFSNLADYAGNIRFSTWILNEALFLTASVYLLNLNKHRYWRWLIPTVLVTTGIFSALTFVLNGSDIRNVGSSIDIAFSCIWLFLIPSALQQRRQWKWTLLLLLSLWWLTSTFILLGYIFNFYYTSAFSSSKVVAEVVVTLGLLFVYSRQKHSYERQLERQIHDQEKLQREHLERTVEARTLKLHQAVDEASKANAVKSEFLARITHDLRSPLTSILGYAQLLLAEQGKAGEMSRTIHGNASHMLHLVNRLIDYARGEGEGDIRLTDLYLFTFLNHIAQDASITAQKNGNRFQLITAPGLPHVVLCDKNYLRQILLNLLDNAAKHTVEGKIQLYVGHSKGSTEHDVTLEFRVTDNGCGIPLELQSRVWEAFYQPAGQQGGLGLGLSIVQQLTQQLGGALTFESVVDKGTEVGLTLPVTLGREEDIEATIMRLPQHLLPSLDAEGLTAWVVEDSPSILEFLSTELGGLGFSVETFDDSNAVIEALSGSSTPPDLVLTDYHLPGASGDTVLVAFKQRWPQVPVILLSATQRTLAPEVEGAGNGYAARLSKPVDLIMLRRELAKACQRELAVPGQPHTLSASAPPDSASLDVTLDTDERQQLEYFLALGAVSDLMEWCQELAEKTPARKAFAAMLYSLAEQGHFNKITQLIRTD